MIDRTSKLSIKRQCALCKLPRSTAYYKAVEVSEAEHELMRRIDKLHLQYPFAGSRMSRDILKRLGYRIGRRRVRTLMKKKGIDALYRKPNTSRRHKMKPIYPYLLRGLPIMRPNQVCAAVCSSESIGERSIWRCMRGPSRWSARSSLPRRQVCGLRYHDRVRTSSLSVHRSSRVGGRLFRYQPSSQMTKIRHNPCGRMNGVTDGHRSGIERR